MGTAKTQDQRPTREVIAEALTAFKNETPTPPTLNQFESTFHAVETRLRTHINNLGSTINNHTSTKIDTTAAQVAAQQQLHHNHLAHQLQLMTSASREYSQQMSGIFSALNNGPPEGPPATHGFPDNITFDV